jgi:hypothetical protein
MEYNKLYTFDLTGKVSFCDLTEEQLYIAYRDARVSSHLIEYQLTHWFPNLERVDQTGFDLIDHSAEKRKIDQKSFTKHGCNFAPSNMIGKGRSVEIWEATSHAKSIDYVITDVVEFPIVRLKFFKGYDLIERYPNLKIPKSNKARRELFDL